MKQFSEDVRVHVSKIAASLERLEGLIAETAIVPDLKLREELAANDEIAEQERLRATVVNAEFDKLVKSELAEASAKLASWKAKRDTSHLHARADRIERCAMIAVEIAMLAMCEVERTALRAVLARREAIAIQVQRTDGNDPER